MCVGRGERNQEKVISSLAVGQLARKQKAMLAAVMEAMRLWWAGNVSEFRGIAQIWNVSEFQGVAQKTLSAHGKFYPHIEKTLSAHGKFYPHIEKTLPAHGKFYPHIEKTLSAHGKFYPHIEKTLSALGKIYPHIEKNPLRACARTHASHTTVTAFVHPTLVE